MQPLKRFLPLAAFLLLVVLLVRGLSLDPTELPSARLGDSLPDFNLPVLGESVSRQAEDWRGEPALINVWATWCFSCRVEHPYLLELAQNGVTIYGLNYKDDPEKHLSGSMIWAIPTQKRWSIKTACLGWIWVSMVRRRRMLSMPRVSYGIVMWVWSMSRFGMSNSRRILKRD